MPPEPFCAVTAMAMKHVKIQKQRFFIDGLIRLKNVLIKGFITDLFIRICKNKAKF